MSASGPAAVGPMLLFTTNFRLLPRHRASNKRREVGNTNEREVMSHLGDKESDVSTEMGAQ